MKVKELLEIFQLIHLDADVVIYNYDREINIPITAVREDTRTIVTLKVEDGELKETENIIVTVYLDS